LTNDKRGDLGLQVWNEANLWAVSQEMKSESCTAQELPLKAPERAKVTTTKHWLGHIVRLYLLFNRFCNNQLNPKNTITLANLLYSKYFAMVTAALVGLTRLDRSRAR
jgi:hypothetical protein